MIRRFCFALVALSMYSFAFGHGGGGHGGGHEGGHEHEHEHHGEHEHAHDHEHEHEHEGDHDHNDHNWAGDGWGGWGGWGGTEPVIVNQTNPNPPVVNRTEFVPEPMGPIGHYQNRTNPNSQSGNSPVSNSP